SCMGSWPLSAYSQGFRKPPFGTGRAARGPLYNIFVESGGSWQLPPDSTSIPLWAPQVRAKISRGDVRKPSHNVRAPSIVGYVYGTLSAEGWQSGRLRLS